MINDANQGLISLGGSLCILCASLCHQFRFTRIHSNPHLSIQKQK